MQAHDSDLWRSHGIPDWMAGGFADAIERGMLTAPEIRDALQGATATMGSPLSEADALRVWMWLMHPFSNAGPAPFLP